MQLWACDFRREESDNLLGVTERYPFRALCDVVPMPCDGPVITLSKESKVRNALESHPRGTLNRGQGLRVIEFGHSDQPAHGTYRPPRHAKYFAPFLPGQLSPVNVPRERPEPMGEQLGIFAKAASAR
jgi:hypothetical protein